MSDQAGPGVPPPGDDTPWWARTQGGEAPSWWNQPGQGQWQQPPTGQGMPFAARPDPAYARTYTPQPVARAKGALPALLCGILSLVCCGVIVGAIAIYQGSQARYRIRASNGRLSGNGMALAGMVMGGVAVIEWAVWLLLLATGHHVYVFTTTTTP